MHGEDETQLSWREQLRLLKETLLFHVGAWLGSALTSMLPIQDAGWTMRVNEAAFWFEQLKVPSYKFLVRQPRRRGSAPEEIVELTVTAALFDEGPVERPVAFPEHVRILNIRSTASGYRVQFYDVEDRPLLRRAHVAMALDGFNPKDHYIDKIEIIRDPFVVGRAPFVIEFVVERIDQVQPLQP